MPNAFTLLLLHVCECKLLDAEVVQVRDDPYCFRIIECRVDVAVRKMISKRPNPRKISVLLLGNELEGLA